jgi:FKBP-type peptidyl-prolyl cis-trans isomerase SlyD
LAQTNSTLLDAASAAVQMGCVVSMDYTVRLDDGRVVETTWGKTPVEYLHGGGQLLPALERALEGLAEGEQAEFVIQPEDAYGPRRDENLASIPRSAFPNDVDLKPGVALLARTSSGQGFPLTVREVTGDQVLVDMNHPLAGERLSFEVTIRAVRAAGPGEVFSGKPLAVEKV